MPTHFHEDNPVHAIVSAALPALFEQCAAQGVSAAEVEGYLKTRFGTDQMFDTLWDYFHPPVKQADLVTMARAAAYEGETAKAKTLALEWLRQTHDVGLGDYITVSGWAKPREILLEDFQFSFEAEKADPWLVFDGPTVHSGGIEEKSNLIEHSVFVAKRKGPSPRLANYLRTR